MIRASRYMLRSPGTKTAYQYNGCIQVPASRHLSSSSSPSPSPSPSLIPERSLWDTIYSGTKGIISLISSEASRRKFMVSIESTSINADVLKQARFGNMLTIALFHDLQDPLFTKYSFHAKDFLNGVKPALRNFHDTVGQLQNEFPSVTSKEERTEKLLQRMHQIMVTSSSSSRKSDDNMTLPDNTWKAQADENPESQAGKLQKMVSPKLFDSLFLTTETASMLANYKDGSTNVSYVALLSARAMVMDEEEYASASNSLDTTTTTASKDATDDSTASTTDDNTSQMEAKADGEENVQAEDETLVEEEFDTTPVAAQIEVLYEMNQKIEVKPEIFEDPINPATDALKTLKEEVQRTDSITSTTTASSGSNSNDANATPPISKDETQIWVGTFEGWLNGGGDHNNKEGLRWRLTHLRPPHAEFPGLYGAF